MIGYWASGILFVLFGTWLVVHASLWLPQYLHEEEASFMEQVLREVNAKTDSQIESAVPVVSAFPSFLQHLRTKLPVGTRAMFVVSSTSFLIGLWVWSLGLPCIQAVRWLLLLWGLTVLAAVDAQTKLLPDMLTIPLLWLGLAIQLLPQTSSIGLEAAVWGAIAGYLPVWLIATAYQLIRKREGLGMGDLKLLSVLGAWSGIYVIPQVLFFASILSLIAYVLERFALRKSISITDYRPFGPYLVAAYAGILMVTGL